MPLSTGWSRMTSWANRSLRTLPQVYTIRASWSGAVASGIIKAESVHEAGFGAIWALRARGRVLGERSRLMPTYDSQQTNNSQRRQQHRQNQCTSAHAIPAESGGYPCPIPGPIRTHYSLVFTVSGPGVAKPQHSPLLPENYVLTSSQAQLSH